MDRSLGSCIIRTLIRVIVIVGLAPLAGAAFAQQITQLPYSENGIAAFHGDGDILIGIIHHIEKFTGCTVVEIRFSETNGKAGCHAVVAKGAKVESIHIDQKVGNILRLDTNARPLWMLRWRDAVELHLAKYIKVTLSDAIRTAEQSQNGAPAVAAGIARRASFPPSDAHTYNVLLAEDGITRRIAVDESSGQLGADPQDFSKWP